MQRNLLLARRTLKAGQRNGTVKLACRQCRDLIQRHRWHSRKTSLYLTGHPSKHSGITRSK